MTKPSFETPTPDEIKDMVENPEKEKPLSLLDKELDTAIEAAGDSIEDRAYLEAFIIRELLNGAYKDRSDSIKADETSGSLKHTTFVTPSRAGNHPEDVSGRRFITPGVPVEGRDDTNWKKVVEDNSTSRETNIYTYETPERLITRVRQNDILVIPEEKNPYLYLSMSDCSCMVGRANGELYVAHIGMSEIDQVKGVIEFFKEKGIKTEDIQVVAREGHDDEFGVDTDHYNSKRAEPDVYESLGIPSANIRTFAGYKQTPVYDSESGAYLYSELTNLAGVLVTKDYIHSEIFDCKQKESTAWGFTDPREEVTVSLA